MVASRTLVVVSTAFYLTSYNDCLTGFSGKNTFATLLISHHFEKFLA